MRSAGLLVALSVLGSLVSLGCNLINSDITALTFELPTKSYHFDTQGMNIPAGTAPRVACGPSEAVTDCCAPPVAIPGLDCAAVPLTCDGGFCTGHKTVSVAQMMNLGQEAPELRNVTGQSLADIFIKRITYTASNNLNVPLPEVTLYLAPAGVTDPASAMKFGTVPSVAAHSTASGDVVLDPAGQQTFSGYAHNFGTPFGFIAATTLDVPPDSPFPNGSVDISVTGTISAQPSL
jgi:hypothetical protein